MHYNMNIQDFLARYAGFDPETFGGCSFRDQPFHQKLWWADMLGRSAEYYKDLAMISRMVQLKRDEGSLSGRPERWDVGYRYVIVRSSFSESL